jgi:hypothetical protein
MNADFFVFDDKDARKIRVSWIKYYWDIGMGCFLY